MPIQVWEKDLLLRPFHFCFPYGIVKLTEQAELRDWVRDGLKFRNEREMVQGMSTEINRIIKREVKKETFGRYSGRIHGEIHGNIRIVSGSSSMDYGSLPSCLLIASGVGFAMLSSK